jgi:cell division protease FtsH
MALEPYRPSVDPRYRDELDRELDQKIDQAFHRWPWKVRRFIWRILIAVAAVWLVINLAPRAVEFVMTNDMGAAIIQVLLIGAYLFFFIGFQFFLMFYFMGRTRIYWLKPVRRASASKTIKATQRCWKRRAGL